MVQITTKFLRCDDETMKWEGGNVDHPDDPGGRTSRGVTQATYDAYRARGRRARRDVYEMTEVERQEIYVTGYWNAVRGEDLPAGVDLATYDAAVNSGPGRAARWLQHGINDSFPDRVLVKVDGGVGPQTTAAARAVHAEELVEAICAQRRSFVQALRTFRVFGKGWTRRIAHIEATGVAWARQAQGKPVAADARSRRNAAAEEADVARKGATGATAGGGVLGGAGTAADAPMEVVGLIILIALIGGAVLFFRARQEKARAEAFAKVAEEAAT